MRLAWEERGQPDGRSIAFASTEGGKARVWLVNPDGSSPRPLSAGDMSDSFDITWSPGLTSFISKPETGIFMSSIRTLDRNAC